MFLFVFFIWVSPLLGGVGLYFEKRDFFSFTVTSITDITQDNRGCLWIGTLGGLISYDGRTATLLDQRSHPELPANHILSVEFISSTQEIWIGTIAGAVRYDLMSGQMEMVSINRLGIPAIDIELFDIVSTSDGRVFALGGGEVVKSVNEGGMAVVSAYTGGEGSVEVYDIAVGPDDSVWIAASTGILLWNAKTQAFQHEFMVPNPRSILSEEDEIWIGTAGFGVFRFNLSNRELQRFALMQEITSLSMGSDGRIWAGSSIEGLTFIDIASGEIQFCEIDSEHPYALPSRRITTLFRGASGYQWIGTADAGLLSVDPRKSNHLAYIRRSGPQGLPAGTINVIVEDSLGYIWAGGDFGGLVRIDPRYDKIRRYVWEPEQDFFSINSDHVNAIIEDSLGMLWIGTGKGLFVYESEAGGVELPIAISEEWPNLRDRDVLAMAVGLNGSIWVSLRQGLLYKLNPIDRNYVEHSFTISSVPFIMTVDHYGTLWAGSRSNLHIFNDNGQLIRTWSAKGIDAGGIPEGGVTAIFSDSENRIWVGTPTGLVRYMGGGMVNFVDVKFPNNRRISVADISEDSEGNIWVADGRQIHILDREGSYLLTMDEEVGLTPSGLVSSVTRGTNGMMYVGASGEIWVFSQYLVPPPSPGPDVYLTELRILNEHQASGWALQSSGLVTLAPGEKMFTMGYGAVYYRYQSNVGFEYRLTGFHDDWIDRGDTNSVTFANLPPGHYNFAVRAYNENGVYSDESVMIAIDIKPPFWLTPIAVGIYFLILAVLVTIIVKLREGRLLINQVRELENVRRKVLEANKRLEFLTMSDALTGLLNRRGFDEAVVHGLMTANRNNLMITLFMLDVDFFKAYNDNYGHVKGDAALRSIATVFRSVFERSTDIIARYGGEEFAVVFIGEKPNASVTLANDLITAIEELAIPHDFSSVSNILTLSSGSATVQVTPKVTMEKLIQQADQALYVAKEGGRNRICFTGIIPKLPNVMKNSLAPLVCDSKSFV